MRRIADAHDGTVEAVPLRPGVKFRFRGPETAPGQLATEEATGPGRAGPPGHE